MGPGRSVLSQRYSSRACSPSGTATSGKGFHPNSNRKSPMRPAAVRAGADRAHDGRRQLTAAEHLMAPSAASGLAASRASRTNRPGTRMAVKPGTT